MNNNAGNALIHETSPYLLQHAFNPVNWFPWSESTLAKAKQNDLLIIISIGYSACHWCHVMEKESFEDAPVAEIMNKHYISVKVDREERPDVDQVYMQACYAVNGNGGWPLNVIALPDGRPVYAGTYFPREKWKQLLEYFAELYRSQPEILERQASEIKNDMQSFLDSPFDIENKVMAKEDMSFILKRILGRIDTEKGGLMGAPKFPMPSVFEFLLKYHALTQDEQAKETVLNTLDNMAAGGIYDQLGGGFFRYSTDSDWLVPHFEKMLYDNAQLISLYAHAYMLSQKHEYKELIRQSISFITRMLSTGEGGFYSSLDADSEGEEGKYYTWQKEEIRNIAGNDTDWLASYYNISAEGNWEDGKNILHYAPGEVEEPRLKEVKKILLQERNKRVHPALDNKTLTAWNALMINALIDAYKALGDKEYLSMALNSANFIEAKLIGKDYAVFRNYKHEGPAINGFLDDYAFMANAFLNLYQQSLDEHWAYLALNLVRRAVNDFYDPQHKRFYYNSSDDPQLIIRPSESDDNVIPSSTAVMMENMHILSAYFDDSSFAQIRSEVMKSMAGSVINKPVFHSFWAGQFLSELSPIIEIVISGKNAVAINKELQQHYLPGILISGGKKVGTFSSFGYKYIEGKTLIYVCVDKACKLPVETVGEAMDILRTLRPSFEK